MSTVRIALANLRVPSTPDESVSLATSAVADAGRQSATVICFPECFVPGYRWPGETAPAPDPAFLERAWAEVARAAGAARITVILGTERITSRGLQITACVINPDGTVAGWQDKAQLDPSEEATYPAFGTERQVFTAGPLTFGVVICHEGFRYPETVRWAVRRGAQVVFHPHADVAAARQLSPAHVRGSGQHVPREGDAVSRGGEHVLLRVRELRKRRLRHDVGNRASGRYAAGLSALRTGGPPRGGPGPQHGDRTARFAVPDVADVNSLRRERHRGAVMGYDIHITRAESWAENEGHWIEEGSVQKPGSGHRDEDARDRHSPRSTHSGRRRRVLR